MKTFRTTLAALLALAALAGCRHVEQELPETVSGKTVRFHAGTADTRTAFAEAVDGVYQTHWTENDSDVLLSLNYGKAVASAVTPSADWTTATFEASFDASATASPYTFYAISPASAARAISPSRNAWSVYIAAEQTPSALSVDEAAQLLVAKSAAAAKLPDEVDLHFAHLTAYGRIELKNLELGEAKVTKADLVFDTPVVGEFYWGEDGTLTSNGASHTITLTTDASGDLWFACAPVSVGNTRMALTLFTDQGFLYKEIVFPEGRSFASGKVARFSVDMAGIEIRNSSDRFTLVSAPEQLEAGMEVIFLDESEAHAMSAENSNGNYREEVSEGFVVTGASVDVTSSQVAVFTLEAGTSSGTWSFKSPEGYLAASTTNNNYLKTQKEKNDYASWSVDLQSDGTATVTAKEGARNLLRYNPSYPRFSCYRNGQSAVKLYRKGQGHLVEDDPLTAESAYGCYITGAQRTYVPGTDQLLRSYQDGKLEFVILNAAEREQLVISGFDPTLTKGGMATVTVRYRKEFKTLLKKEYTLPVVKEDGSKVWLGDGSGQGFILKK